MQRDFHYYCIGVLARAAGFSSEDALTVAYASQYVDDATESEPIPLQVQEGELAFEPVRTSYATLEQLRSLSWSAQKRVWIPFHFIPARPFHAQEGESFSFVTKRGSDSPFVQQLLERAASEPPENRKRRLCRIGIALHTYADTWAHQRFSGRQNRTENDAENIHLYHRDDDTWEHPTIENILFDILPEIGHAEVLFFADVAYQKWNYLQAASNQRVERDNSQEFLGAAKTIYGWLRATKEKEGDGAAFKEWEELEPTIHELLLGGPEAEIGLMQRLTLSAYRAYCAFDVERRCERWRGAFAHLFEPISDRYAYDRKRWRDEAFEGDTEWDDFTLRDWEQISPRKTKPDFWDCRWVHFHRAALRQRHFVLENLP
jgi:hypothetical protein